MPTTMASRTGDKKLKNYVIAALVALGIVATLFAPIIPISYEEIIGFDVDEPIGRAATKNVSIFQIITGTE